MGSSFACSSSNPPQFLLKRDTGANPSSVQCSNQPKESMDFFLINWIDMDISRIHMNLRWIVVALIPSVESRDAPNESQNKKFRNLTLDTTKAGDSIRSNQDITIFSNTTNSKSHCKPHAEKCHNPISQDFSPDSHSGPKAP